MTKPRLAKVRALFYVLQQVTKEAAPILTQPRSFVHRFKKRRLRAGGIYIAGFTRTLSTATATR